MAAVKPEVNKINTLTGHRDCVYSLEQANEPNCFFSGAGDGMVVKWDLNNPDNGELIAKVKNSVYSLCHLPNENQLIVGHNFEGLHLIDLATKKEISSSKITDSYIFDIKYCNGQVFAATGDGTIVILSATDLTTLAKLKTSDRSARTIAVCAEKNFWAVGFSDNYIRIFDLRTHKLLLEIPAHTNSVFTLELSKDNRYLLSGSRDAHLKIWDVDAFFEPVESIVAHLYAINSICYSPDKNFFATCSMDKSIKIWDAQRFRLLKVIDRVRHAGHGTSVNKLLWLSYTNYLVSCSDDRTISVWDLKNLNNEGYTN